MQEVHLVLTASFFEDHSPVAIALGVAHWILVESSMEHVGRIQLRSMCAMICQLEAQC